MVARHEFLKNVKRKQFILMTFGFPLFFVLIILVPFLLFAMSPAEDLNIGYIDRSGQYDFPAAITRGQVPDETNELPATEGLSIGGILVPKQAQIHFIRYNDTTRAKQDLLSGVLSGYLVIPGDYIRTGIIESYVLGKGKTISSRDLSELMVNNLLQDKVDDDTFQRIKDPVSLREFTVEPTGDVREKGLSDLLQNFALPHLIGVLLIISILTSAGYLLQGVAEEKENRVMEILLSSMTSREMLTGKIVGLGSVGLLQVAIWLSVGFAGSFFIFALAIDPLVLVLGFVYFILGFLLFASLMAGVGAISGSVRESQQVISLFTLPAVIPLLFIQVLISKPDGILSIVLSLFPMTSPVAMLIRIGAADVPVYQIALSVLILAVSVYVVILASARLFRVGLLMYGKRPRPGQIIGYIRAGD